MTTRSIGGAEMLTGPYVSSDSIEIPTLVVWDSLEGLLREAV